MAQLILPATVKVYPLYLFSFMRSAVRNNLNKYSSYVKADQISHSTPS